MNMPVRTALWTLLMAFFGFLFVGRGLPVVNSATIGGAFVGAFLDFSSPSCSKEGRNARRPELLPIRVKAGGRCHPRQLLVNSEEAPEFP